MVLLPKWVILLAIFSDPLCQLRTSVYECNLNWLAGEQYAVQLTRLTN